MSNLYFLLHSQKTADVNLQLIETILELDNTVNFKISDELREMLEYILEINWQQYRLTNENLKTYGYVL